MIRSPKFFIISILAVVFLISALPAAAQVSIDIPAGFAGFSSQDLKVTIGNLVRVIVGFMGLFLIIIILIGGLKWMTSGGNEDKIAAAKKFIGAGIVGLVIILMAYSIAGFLTSSLSQAV